MIPQTFDFKKIQNELKRVQMDGWLAIDFKGRNEIALEVLGFPPNPHITRRWFYFVPVEGEPYKVSSAIEPDLLDHLPGSAHTFLSYGDFCTHLQQVLKGHVRVALEYSPEGKIPSLSFVDAGTLELVRKWNVEPVSSQEILQPFLSRLTPEQMESQKRASVLAEEIMHEAWDFVGQEVPVSEGDVQKFILKRFADHGLITEWNPIVAVNANSALPHYTPHDGGDTIRPGDFLLIDLGCKEPNGVYADITRVACVKRDPTDEETKIFNIVKNAQSIGFEAVKKPTTGARVDKQVRAYITQQGYGDFFIHRTGHNITTKPHGPGAHLDSLETLDERPLIENSCFSIEPGIYLPKKFGIRLESTILLLSPLAPVITGGIQSKIFKIN